MIEPAQEGGPRDWARRARPAPFLGAALVLAALLLYLPTVRYPFVHFDDNRHILDNPMVVGGLTPAGLKWALTTGYAANWMPLTWLSHQADVSLFGMWPGGHHLMNVLWHSVDVGLLFLVLLALTGATWPSAAAAALFAVHPLHVESVAWVSSRKDVLSAMFFLLTIACYLRYLRRPGFGRYLLILLAFGGGIMSKPTVVTLPLLLLLLDIWPLGRRRFQWLRLIAEKIPLLLLSAVSAVITWRAQSLEGVVHPLDTWPFRYRLGNAPMAYVTYLRRLFWPSDLAFFYPHPRDKLAAGYIAASTALLVLVTILALLAARRRPFIPVGWFWFLTALLPMIGLVQVGGQALADRYAYLPFIGLYILLAWSWASLRDATRGRLPAGCLLAVALVALALATANQMRYWRSDRDLFERGLQVTKGNYLAHLNLGTLEIEAGRPEKALEHLSYALMIKADYLQAHENLATALASLGRYEEAIYHLTAALEIDPEKVDDRIKLGLLMDRVGNAAAAVNQLSQAARFRPGDPNLRFNLATALAKLGRRQEAVEQYREVLRLAPDDQQARRNLQSLLDGGEAREGPAGGR